MKKQQGMATLLITSVLLLVALLFSLASYKNLFYQIKRSQNEVFARQAHWQAEGGLECGISILSYDKKDTVTNCNSLFNDLKVHFHKNEFITSKSNNRIISKNILLSNLGGYGVIKSSADLYFKGDNKYYVDPTDQLVSEGKWKCVLLRYQSKLFIHDDKTTKLTNINFSSTTPPYENFDVTDECDSQYKTELTSSSFEFKKDIRHEEKLDVFKETFGVDRDNWMDVKNKIDEYGDDVFLDVDVSNSNNCAKEIINALNVDNNKEFLWITGDCFLEESTGMKDLTKKSKDYDNGLFMVFQNGLLSINGTADNFNGVIYHFINSYNHINDGVNNWSESTYLANYFTMLDSYKYIGVENYDNKLLTEMRDKVVFFMNGSFKPTGGYIFDMPGRMAYFNLATEHSYSQSVMNSFLEKLSSKPRWKEGSWRDF